MFRPADHGRGIQAGGELRRCLKEIGRHVGAVEAELSLLKKTVKDGKWELAEFLVGKACAYEDLDFYREAVKLIGQRMVTLMKLHMDLPLWDEDKKYVVSVLDGTE